MRPIYRARRPAAGFTLLEVLVVLAILGILASFAAPRLNRYVEQVRARSAMDQLRGDLYHARALAARYGERTVVRFQRVSASPRCYSPHYRLIVRGTPEQVLKESRLELSPGSCLDIGAADSISFNSRGLPTGVMNRKIRLVRGAAGDSLAMNAAGRLRRY